MLDKRFNFLTYFYFFTLGCAGLLLHRFSLVAVSSGCSLVAVHGLLIVVASLVTRTQILGHTGFSS